MRLQFFPDRTAALGEMRRAAKPGGRVGVSAWCSIDQCPPFDALATALGRVLGPETQQAYAGGPWGLGDKEEQRRLFGQAGLSDVTIERRTLPIVFDGGPAQLVASLATSSLRPKVDALDEHGREKLLAATVEALAPLLHNGEVRSELAAHVVTATIS